MDTIPAWTLTCLLALTIAVPAAADDEEESPVIAEVNGLVITVEDLERAAKRKRPEGGVVDEALKREVLEDVVNEFLIYHQALEQELDEDPKIRKMMVNTLLKRDVYGHVRTEDITEDELRAYFEAHVEDFVVPEKVQIKRLEIRTESHGNRRAARMFVEDLQRQVALDPTLFKALAQTHSSCPYARRGGDIGFVGRNGKPGVDPGVVELAFTLAKGEVSPVVEIESGFYFLYIPNRRERVERTFEQMRGSVLRKVKSVRYEELYDSFLAELRDGATVVVNVEALVEMNLSVDPASIPLWTPPNLGDEDDG